MNSNRKSEGGLRTRGHFKQKLQSKTLVTIITAVYNGEENIEKTIKSVINQTYDNVEYIIIDGGSKDSTVEIIKKYDNFIDYWVSEKDSGIYDAWNKGVSLSAGDWIAFLGAGDAYFSSAILTYIMAIKNCDTIPDFISSRNNFVNSKNKILRIWGEPFEWCNVKSAMKFAHVGAFHKRNIFEKYGLFDISYKSSGDYEFFMRCGKDIHTVFIEEVTASVLVGGMSMNDMKSLQETRIIQKIYGINALRANFNYYIAFLKRKIRPFLRGY